MLVAMIFIVLFPYIGRVPSKMPGLEIQQWADCSHPQFFGFLQPLASAVILND
jgi:hypothetical protein